MGFRNDPSHGFKYLSDKDELIDMNHGGNFALHIQRLADGKYFYLVVEKNDEHHEFHYKERDSYTWTEVFKKTRKIEVFE